MSKPVNVAVGCLALFLGVPIVAVWLGYSFDDIVKPAGPANSVPQVVRPSVAPAPFTSPAPVGVPQTSRPVATIVAAEQGGYKETKWGEPMTAVLARHPDLKAADPNSAGPNDLSLACYYFHSLAWDNTVEGVTQDLVFEIHETPGYSDAGSKVLYWFIQQRFVGVQVEFFNVPSVLPSLQQKYGGGPSQVSDRTGMEFIAWRVSNSRIVVWTRHRGIATEFVSYFDPALYDRQATKFAKAEGQKRQSVEKPLD